MARKKSERTRRAFGKVSVKGKRVYAEYTGPDGRIHTPGHSFPSKIDAEGWLAGERRLIDLSAWTPPKQRQEEKARRALVEEANGMTVGELVDDWLTRATNLRETTRRTHRKKLELRALCPSIPGKLDSLKDVRVMDVDRQRVRLWVEQMLAIWPYGEDGYHACYYAHKRLVTAFNWAKNELELIESNPVSRVKMRKPIPRNRDEPVFTSDEAKTIVNTFPKWLQHAPLILLYCGLRPGEMLELRLKDISGITPGATMVLKVRRNMQDVDRVEGGGKEILINDVPKTDAALRDVHAPVWVADAIRKHLKDMGKTSPDDLVVSRKNGNQFSQGNFRDRYFNPAKRAAGRGEDSTEYSCRHFYGTQLVRLVMAGMLSLEEARRLMGHETTQQLMEYMRAEAGYQQRAAAALNELQPKGEVT